jgi:ribosomal protein S18 acetylase RimI-like enzyme
MATSIVDARRDHAAFIAWVILAAWRSHLPKGLWDFLLDGDDTVCLRFLEALTTSNTRHLTHWSTFLVAEVDRVPAAALSGYFDADLGLQAMQSGMNEANQQLRRSPDEIAAGLGRIAPVLLVAPDHEPGVWIVENVATHPDYRRRGLVQELLAAILERGRQLGATRADIGVMIGNDRAQWAYERAGFQVTGEKRHPDFEAVWKCPGIRALSRPL